MLAGATLSLSLLAGEPEPQSQVAQVSTADFTTLAGDGWSGSLIYLDYSSNTEQSIPVEIRFDHPGARKVVYHIKYPGESQYNATEKLKWSRDGRELNGETLVSRSLDADGSTVLVTEHDGKDDNRLARIRMTYSINDSALTISKDVRFDDEAEFFRRNAYELVR